MVNFGLLQAEIVSLVWGTPANFNGFRILASLLHRHQSREWVDGSWVMGQMGHENRMGHMGHGSLGVDP